MLAFVFPGQGSQFKGMGRDLFDAHAEFLDVESELKRISGFSVRELCLEADENILRQTQYTQPCLFVVNHLHYLRAKSQKSPDFLAGHSLGEFNAMQVAGVFDFVTGFRLVCERGRLMSEAKNGAMAAVLGKGAGEVQDILVRAKLASIDLANLNAPTQVILSGPEADIAAAEAPFREAGANFIRLPVGAAFHSRYMKTAAQAFEARLRDVRFRAPSIPVLSNVTGAPYPSEDPQVAVPALLARQISSPVKWQECVGYMKARGVDKFEECGPGVTLTRMIQQIPASTATDRTPSQGTEAAPPTVRAQPAPPKDRLWPTSSAPPAPHPTRGGESFAPSGATSNQGLATIAAPRPTTREALVTPAPAQGATALAGSTRQPTINTPTSQRPVDKPKAPDGRGSGLSAEHLGSATFRSDYSVKYAYVAGSMYKGIASVDMVVALGRQRLLSFFGTGGLDLDEISAALTAIQAALPADAPFGMNLLNDPSRPEFEEATVRLYLERGVRNIEAAAYMSISPPLALFRIKGAYRHADGRVLSRHRVLAKVSRPEVATAFLRPPSEAVLKVLLERGSITASEAEMARELPMSNDICVESDSGGHTDAGVALARFPAIRALRNEILKEYRRRPDIRVGAAGGIGAPEAAAAMFIMGADFILTGSINQCTVEAGTSDAAKDILAEVQVQDLAYAPAGDMFELGARVQVVRRGLFFHTRANKLYELYSRHGSWEEIDEQTRKQVEEKFFQKPFADVWSDTRSYYVNKRGLTAESLERHPKQKLALTFKWYFVQATRWAMAGDLSRKVDFQIQCGPALGALNAWLKGTELENWRSRRAAALAERLMADAATVLRERLTSMADPQLVMTAAE